VLIRGVRLTQALVALAAATACGPSAATLDRLYDRALDEMRGGQVDAALATAADGAAQATTADDAQRTWRFQLLAADAHLTKLEVSAALAVLERDAPSAPGFEAIRGRQLHLLARAKVAQGQLSAAVPLIEQARPLAGSDPTLLSDLDLLESQVLYRSGRPAEADALLATSRARVEREGDRYRLAQVSIATGMGLVTRGRFDEALPYFETVVADRALDATVVQGQALNNAGLCHARLGQFDRAVALQQQAIQLQARGRKQNHVQALGELGATYLLQNDFARGAEYLGQAFDEAVRGGLAADASLIASNLALAQVAMGKWDDAERFVAEATRLGEQASRPRSPYSAITLAQVALGRGRPDEAVRLYRETLAAPGVTPEVEWTAYDGMARVAMAGGQTRDAVAHFETALQRLEQTRVGLVRADYRISFTSRLRSFYQQYVALLLAEGQVERALEVADASRARVLAERQNVAAAQTRPSAAALKRLARDARTTLVFYWLGEKQSWAWVVTPDDIRATPLPSSSQLDPLVADHQAAIQNALADPLAAPGAAAARLYAAVVQPIGPLPTPRVVIVPDGSLHRLNFETLLVPAPAPHYWIDDVTIQVAPSLAMLSVRSGGASALSTRSGGASAPADPGVPAHRTLLLIGNPAPRPPEFPALGYAPAEMQQIQEHFPPGAVSMLDGEQASPEGFVAAGPERYPIIHFTSHAVANTESPLDSAVILSGPTERFKLYARDVAALPLKAELVTVSACRSAGERAYAGEGLVGFAWAFLRAGSRRVVAGLWDVDDRSTALLMGEVYRRLAHGEPPAQALREAKRTLMQQGFAKPYYWAPFQLFTSVL
jgi:CHAT domain-containing protein